MSWTRTGIARSLALSLALVGSAPLLTAAPRTAHAAAAADNALPTDRFAPDVAESARQGWRLADLALDANIDGSGDMTLAVTLVKGTEAQRFSLLLEDWGQAPVEYHRAAVALPTETRVYHDEADLIAALAAGSVTKVYEECGAYYLQTDESDVSLDPYNYHVVDKSVRGAAAGKLLASELGGALGAGMKLVNVTESAAEADQPHTVEFQLSDADTRVIRAELDQKGAVVAVEVLRSPTGGAWQTIHTPGLVKALVKGREVRTLRYQSGAGDDDMGRVVGTLKNGKKFVIDLADVERDEREYEGCGC